MSFLLDFSDLYAEINDCHACTNVEHIKALRNTKIVDYQSDVMLLSQCMVNSGGIDSGVHFYTKTGKLTPMGKLQEKFLNQLNRTLAPENSVELVKGTIAQRDPKNKTVYCTEMCMCHTGQRYASYIRKEITRKPTMTEVKTCLSTGFLRKELERIRPRVIFLSGNAARIGFYRHILKTPVAKEHAKMSITREIEDIVNFTTFPVVSEEYGSILIPIFFPEYRLFKRSTYESKMYNPDFIKTIKNVLKLGDLEWRPPTLFPEDYMAF
ncbi:MAG: uracil-DNA glycosylase family protein [Promethearchaeota archaeon]